MKTKAKLIFTGLFIFIFISICHSEPSLLRFTKQNGGGEESKQRPNVIIITIDTLRADHVGCYGYYRDTTPNIDKFSREAIIFKNAISQAPYTVASMASFITSKYSDAHTIVNFPEDNLACVILNHRYLTLSQILKQKKYLTCFISDQRILFYIKGIKKGFDTFLKAQDNNPIFLTNLALNWISKNKDRPFFIWMHYLGPHHPYHPNKADSLRIPLKEKDKFVPFAKNTFEFFGAISASVRNEYDTNNSLNYYINNYDGKILLTDQQIGILLDEIKKLGLDKNSIIVITSDHGEEFGEHNLYCNHRQLLYNTLLHVPLLIKFPSQASAAKTIKETVGLIDVVPTILDILKLKKPEFDGETLLPLINNPRDKKTVKNRFIFSNAGLKSSVTYNEWKLIHDNSVNGILNRLSSLGVSIPARVKEYELYNLEIDKYEHMNLFKENSEIFNKLKNEITKFREKNKDERTNRAISLFRELDDEGYVTKSEEEVEKLKSLGYMN